MDHERINQLFKVIDLALKMEDNFTEESPANKALEMILNSLGVTNDTSREINLTYMDFLTGAEKPMSPTEFLRSNSVHDLVVEKNRLETDLRQAEAKVTQCSLRLKMLEALHLEIEHEQGLVEHCKNNYQDAIFDYEMRKGTEE